MLQIKECQDQLSEKKAMLTPAVSMNVAVEDVGINDSFISTILLPLRQLFLFRFFVLLPTTTTTATTTSATTTTTITATTTTTTYYYYYY